MFNDLGDKKNQVLASANKFIELCKSTGREDDLKDVARAIANLDVDKYSIAVVGQMKRGKSTLINTLLGRGDDQLSPIDALVCTGSVVHYLPNDESQGHVNNATVYFQDNSNQKIQHSQLRNYISEKLNPKNAKRVSHILAYGDFPVLNRVVSLVDTPGFGAIHRHHEELLKDNLEYFDAIVFLIAADLPLEAAEIQFLKYLAEHHKGKVFFVMTKVDEVDPSELDEVRGFVQSNLDQVGYGGSRVYEVSARQVYRLIQKGGNGHDLQQAMDESGMQCFVSQLERYILETSGKTQPILRNISIVYEMIEAKTQQMKAQMKAQIALYEEGTELIEAELSELSKAHEVQKKDFEKLRSQFDKDWDRCVSKFQRAALLKSDEVEDKIYQKVIKGVGLPSTAKLNADVTQAVNREVSKVIQQEALKLEEDLSEVTKRFEQTVNENMEIYVFKRQKNELGDLGKGMAVAGMHTISGLVAATQATSVFTAAMNVYSASTLVQGSVGALPWIKGFFLGTASTAAGAGKVAAVTGLVSTVGTAIPLVLGAYGLAVITKAVVKHMNERELPGKIEKVFEEGIQGVIKRLDETKNLLLEAVEQELEAKILSIETRLQEVLEAQKRLDPASLPKLKEAVEEVDVFLKNVVLDKALSYR